MDDYHERMSDWYVSKPATLCTGIDRDEFEIS